MAAGSDQERGRRGTISSRMAACICFDSSGEKA